MASVHAMNGGSNADHLPQDFSSIMAQRTQGPQESVVHRRIFVGPMPERVISHTESQTNQRRRMTLGSVFSLTSDADRARSGDKSEEIARVVKAHAFRFFLHEGGRAADWDEFREENIVEELMNRWKDSDWGQLWSRRQDTHRRKRDGSYSAGTSQWFGASFEVGNLLGVNVLQGGEHLHAKSARTDKGVARSQHGEIPGSNTSLSHPPRAAPSYPRMDTATTSIQTSHYESALTSPVFDEATGDEYVAEDSTPTSSVTGLLHKDRRPLATQELKAKSQPNLHKSSPPDIGRSQSDMPPGIYNKGKARMVHYEIAPISEDITPPSEEPVPPKQVLQRKRSSLDKNTSLAATVDVENPIDRPIILPKDVQCNDVVLRDRMLVRVTYTKNEGITHFDEMIARTTRDLKFEDWGEFLVVWRKDSVEIYRDHNTPGKEWMTGRKHLSYVIPLKSSRTKLSLFSFVDLTFCITCAPTTTKLNESASRWIFSREKEGTNIFVFKLKSRSRGYDWIWKLWRSMGGQIPPTIDIHNPRLSTKVSIDAPEDDAVNPELTYQVFARENVIQLCTDALHNVADWKYVMDEHLNKGYSLELAWRSAANLDWIWLEDDVAGKPRGWYVLAGLPLRQLASKPPTLEIRLALHASTHVHLKTGKRLEEPPSIEGYLDRVRPNSQTKQPTYLTIHHGQIFVLNPLTASPPLPPGLNDVTTGNNLAAQIQNIRHSEIRRGTNQIMGATSVLDLRTIVTVRRAFHTMPAHMHDHKDNTDEDTLVYKFTNAERTSEEDMGDEGGEAGLSGVQDRPRVRMRRSFELLLKTGHVLRFEAHSCQVAIEWINRLRALVLYWKQRHRTDAKQEIELAQAQKPRLTPQTRAHCDDEEHPPNPPADLRAPFAAMDSLYNWCILEGCKPMVKGGRLYMRKGLRGQYKLIQLYLVAGHLVRFRIIGNSTLYPAVRKKTNLLDAYVLSGYLAAQCLPKGQYTPNATPTPRRYQDGLETDDREEDMMFIVWYRSQPQIFDANQDPTVIPATSRSVPSISAKNKMLVFKTRSILERDAWCWAINSEIEKVVRAQKVREEKLRETGDLVKLRK